MRQRQIREQLTTLAIATAAAAGGQAPGVLFRRLEAELRPGCNGDAKAEPESQMALSQEDFLRMMHN